MVPLAPRVGGEVAQVSVKENQAVKKGDLLLVIDHADLAARARQAEADLAVGPGAVRGRERRGGGLRRRVAAGRGGGRQGRA